MDKTISVLFVGETWFFRTIEVKGFDNFTIGGYDTGVHWIMNALNSDGFEFTHIPSHEVHIKFPTDLESLQKYDLVLVSDVGANTFLLNPDTFFRSIPTVNKLNLIHEYVKRGGGFGMIGGYMTFQGIEAKAQYKGTAIEEILPVNLISTDDRVEIPQGFNAEVNPNSHPILNGLPQKWPALLGYNRLLPKENSEVLVSHGSDPIITLGTFGEGRTLAYATDCSPHWASPEFCNWEYYKVLWRRLASWLAGR